LINIDCSSNCKYQQDGKCCLEKIQIQKVSGKSDCIYFIPNTHWQLSNKIIYYIYNFIKKEDIYIEKQINLHSYDYFYSYLYL